VLNTATDVIIAAHYRAGQETFYAADAGLARAVDELGSTADWNALLNGSGRSAAVDGPSSGVRALQDGSTVDLGRVTNFLNCAHAGVCTDAEMDASIAPRPWGRNNPRWSLYSYGPLGAVLPGSAINPGVYLAVWVGDDPSENDDDPYVDGADASNPGHGVVMAHAEAFGPGGAHSVLEATVGRPDPTAASGIRVIDWRELR
jgi:hypothetical protein